MRRRLPISRAALAALAALLLPVAAPAAAHAADPPRGTYAVLGDSFAGGEGTGSYVSGTATTTNNCHRSLLAGGVRARATLHPDTTLEFGACSGARVEDFANPFNRYGSHLVDGRVTNATEGPQLDHLDAGTQVVVLGVGGNDIGFGTVLDYCASRPSSAQTCQSKYSGLVSRGISSLTAADPMTSLPQLYAKVRAAAPSASVYVTGYPRLFPATAPSTPCKTGSPVKKNGFYLFGTPAYFTASDMAWFNTSTRQLNAVIETQTKAAGFTYVDTYEALAGHDVCSSTRWVNKVVMTSASGGSFGADWVTQQSFHPNSAGQAALGKAIEAAMVR